MARRFRLVAALGAVALLLFSLGGCGAGPSSSGGPATGGQQQGESKLLRIKGEAWIIDKAFVRDAAERFKQRHSGVEVQISQFGDGETSNVLLQWSQGKTDADLFLGPDASWMVGFVAKGLVHSWDDLNFFTGDFAQDKFVPVFLNVGKINGKVYALPLMGETYALNANKQALQEAGLMPGGKVAAPKDWNELVDWAAKLHKTEGGKVVRQGGTVQWNSNMIYAMFSALQGARGTIFLNDGRTLAFDTPEMKQILENWLKGAKSGAFSTDIIGEPTGALQNFKAGKLALFHDSSSRVTEALNTLGPDSAVVVPLPGSVEHGSLAFISGMLVPKASPASDLAVAFVKEELLGEVNQVKTLNTYGKLPTLERHFAKADPAIWGDILPMLKKSTSFPLYKDFPKIWTLSKTEVQKYLQEQQSVDATVSNLQKALGTMDLTTGIK